MNGCRFAVLPRLVAYGGDRAAFYASKSNFVIGSASPAGAGVGADILEVQTIDLRSIVEQHRFERCTLICDIEGGESDLVRHEAEILKTRVATLILEVHEWALGKDRVAEMLKELAELGFQLVHAEADTLTFRNQSFRPMVIVS